MSERFRGPGPEEGAPRGEGPQGELPQGELFASHTSDSQAQEPLPQAWLPAPHPPAGDPAWEGAIHRILAAAEPEMARRAAGVRAAPNRAAPNLPHWVELGRWWRPALAAAAVAAALLFAVDRPTPTAGAGGIALSLVAAEGDPVALWRSLGVAADPVLAFLAFADHEPFLTGASGAAVGAANGGSPAEGEPR